MDNLSSHKGPKTRSLIEAAGASWLFLPPSSPHCNPIDGVFAKRKARLRQAAERTIEALRSPIGRRVDTFAPRACANYFSACG